MNPLEDLQRHGQAVWLDYIRRTLITSGELQRLVEQDGLRGVTSNPTIFDKAIAGSADYDEELGALLTGEARAGGEVLFEMMALEDIRRAADILRRVYDATEESDGYVSLEVSPRLAHDTVGTVAEARRLWQALDRPNIMIKVPATPEGIPAIETLIGEGINVNVTLIFSLSHYEAAAQAYLRGVARAAHPERVASVASFFVSRVDTAVDRALEALGTSEALALRGHIAVANVKLAYRRFREIFYGEAFAALRRRGARVQRPLWASTGTKNPAYSDVLYVEELVGPETVNTVPPATLNAFRHHGRVRGATVMEGLSDAEAALTRLAALDADLPAITEQLQVEGLAAFSASFDQLLQSLEKKSQSILVERLDPQRLTGRVVQPRVAERLRAWQTARFGRRVWGRDPSLWSVAPVPELTDRLGWLTLPETMHEQVDDLRAFADEVSADGIGHVVLLGMGGSSLAPEVFQRTFGPAAGYPDLIVLDSTHPQAVRAVAEHVNPRLTLFLVSSKSGTTTETLSLLRYFWDQMGRQTNSPGRHFVVITDPDTPLGRLGRERGFRRVFEAPSDVGGRYSALTVFGLIPAALLGIDVHRLLDRAWTMAEASAFCVPEPENPALILGAVLGELARAGRDKATFLASPAIAALPVWIEQLIAESTGKDGKGIVPVVDEPLGPASGYGADRSFIYLRLDGGDSDALDALTADLEAAGHPVMRLRLGEKSDLGQEFFRFELAVAAAGAVLGIHPFNQPDVELAKELARQAMKAATQTGSREETRREVSAGAPGLMAEALNAWLMATRAEDYVTLQAYLAPTKETTGILQEIRRSLRDRLGLATTLGYGPRFLHSTGQLHKGGPNTGLFLQLVDEPREDIPVPETDYTFAALLRAQALGDYQALLQRGRRVLRVQLGRDVAGSLARLAEAVRG